MKKKNNPPGRPPIELDEKQWIFVNQMLQAQCDGASIARHFGMHPETFYDKIVAKYGRESGISNFTEYQHIKRMEGLEMLRNKQFELAMLGDRTMLVWLGKQLLKQRDQIEQTISVPSVSIQAMDEDETKKISAAMAALEQYESDKDISAEPDGSVDNEETIRH